MRSFLAIAVDLGLFLFSLEDEMEFRIRVVHDGTWTTMPMPVFTCKDMVQQLNDTEITEKPAYHKYHTAICLRAGPSADR